LVPLPGRNAGNHRPGLSPHLSTKVYAEAGNHYSHVLLHSKYFKPCLNTRHQRRVTSKTLIHSIKQVGTYIIAIGITCVVFVVKV